MFPQGTKLQVVVIGVDKESRKISLSRNAVSEKVEKDEFSRYRSGQQGEHGGSAANLSSFGELLAETPSGKQEQLIIRAKASVSGEPGAPAQSGSWLCRRRGC